jgi:hypothetical protein
MKFRFVLIGPDDDAGRNPAEKSTEGASAVSSVPRYEQDGVRMIRSELPSAGRLKRTVLTNFVARIVRQVIVVDDGEREQRKLDFEAQLRGHGVAFELTSSEFDCMGGVFDRLGPEAIIYRGQQQHARAAIQVLSGPIRSKRAFCHLGWRKHEAGWDEIEVPSEFKYYRLTSPTDKEALVEAIRASLQILSVGPDRITFPPLAAIYRAVFGGRISVCF